MIWSWPIPTERPLVAPSLLSADFSRLGEEIAEVESAGADLLHLDVMDGQFVRNITMGPVVIAGIRKLTRLYLDAHLMVVEPGRYVREFRDAGCDGITVHGEACADLGATLAAVRESGARVGLSLNPDTPLEPYVRWFEKIDLLLLLSVFPGRGGQAFMPEVVPRIAWARQQRAVTFSDGCNADRIRTRPETLAGGVIPDPAGGNPVRGALRRGRRDGPDRVHPGGPALLHGQCEGTLRRRLVHPDLRQPLRRRVRHTAHLLPAAGAPDGALWRFGLQDPGLVFVLFGLVWAVVCARVAIALFEFLFGLPGPGHRLGLVVMFWGGGALVLAGTAVTGTYALYGVPMTVQGLFHIHCGGNTIEKIIVDKRSFELLCVRVTDGRSISYYYTAIQQFF